LSKSNKPNFSESHGGWIDPDRLSEKDLRRLRIHLPAYEATEKDNFLRRTSEAVSTWELDNPEAHLTLTEIAERIERMEDAAKALQRAIERLQGDPHDTVYPHFDYLILGSSPPIDLPAKLRLERVRFGSLLEGTWEDLQVLRDVGQYARSHIEIDRTAKPSLQNARRLVFWVVNAFRAQFGKYPPTYKGAWFPSYMCQLGDILGIEAKFGYSMLASFINEMKQTDPPD
jgi:hypothetical protein